mmetsp:Transcript_31940/g.82774  ORF Transcript_31940/g.82774 Transcript_31940/m.82774 type:complete len:200 (+) Transcript_31940:2654-3253(+)
MRTPPFFSLRISGSCSSSSASPLPTLAPPANNFPPPFSSIFLSPAGGATGAAFRMPFPAGGTGMGNLFRGVSCPSPSFKMSFTAWIRVSLHSSCCFREYLTGEIAKAKGKSLAHAAMVRESCVSPSTKGRMGMSSSFAVRFSCIIPQGSLKDLSVITLTNILQLATAYSNFSEVSLCIFVRSKNTLNPSSSRILLIHCP